MPMYGPDQHARGAYHLRIHGREQLREADALGRHGDADQGPRERRFDVVRESLELALRIIAARADVREQNSAWGSLEHGVRRRPESQDLIPCGYLCLLSGTARVSRSPHG